MTKLKTKDLNQLIKVEECEDKSKLEELLHGTNNVPNNRSKITKNKITKNKTTQDHIENVKLEDEDPDKANLILLGSQTTITKEQIAKLMHYILIDKMSGRDASKKAGMSISAGRKYYQEYRNDPEYMALSSESNLNNPSSSGMLQNKIKDLIHYIVDDKLSVNQAAIKVGMKEGTAQRHYRRYLNKPDNNIPEFDPFADRFFKRFTKDEINQLFDFIFNENMTLTAAAKKLNMANETAKRYYLKYLEDPNHAIPGPGRANTRNNSKCKNEQVKKLIGYIVDDRMNVSNASLKAGMARSTAVKYYKLYLKDPERNIPVPEIKRHSYQKLTLDQAKMFFSFIIVDQLNVVQASRKANISHYVGHRYNKKYLENETRKSKYQDKTYSVEKMKKMVEYIQKDNMCLKSASAKASIIYSTASRYYQQYLEDPEHRIPEIITEDTIEKLIGCIKDDDMSITSAARKLGMSYRSAYMYYKLYQKDPEHKIPMVHPNENKKILDEYEKIIVDIYKHNPSIGSAQENSHSDTDLNDVPIMPVSVKEEEEEEKYLF